jgi:pilus assembly protein CpaC
VAAAQPAVAPRGPRQVEVGNVPDAPAEIGQSISATVGKSVLLRLDEPIQRISIGDPSIADVTLITTRELYILGKALGGTNVILWTKSGRTTVVDLAIGLDTAPLIAQLRKLLPEERDIKVDAAAGSVVLSGSIASLIALEQAVSLAEAYVRDMNRALILPVAAGDAAVGARSALAVAATPLGAAGGAVNAVGARVVNLLRVREGQQVMLDVKIAEVSRNIIDKLGIDAAILSTSGEIKYSIISQLFDISVGNLLGATFPNGGRFNFRAQRDDGLIKILAEPNIVSISGQEASFLAGGKVFLPVARANNQTGGVTITLEEKEFGVGLKFTPTVLDNGRINLRVSPEVSDILQNGVPFLSTSGVNTVLPAFTSRRASTTVQLIDGQSLAIGGLIKNNVTQTIKAIPILGEIPILGALFRSTDFQNDRTELLFVVTPRVVKPLNQNIALPTDRFVQPTRSELFLEGRLEGRGSNDPVAPQVDRGQPQAAPRPSASGFQVK